MLHLSLDLTSHVVFLHITRDNALTIMCRADLFTIYNIIICCYLIFQQYEFTKAKLPEGADEKIKFSKLLQKYNVSLPQYVSALTQKEIKS